MACSMARPALSLIAPRLRGGGVVHTLTLPFPGGLEFTVRV